MDTQKILSLGERQFVLVGTAHVSEQSVLEVQKAIEDNKPDCVAIELDEKRLANMEDPDAWQKMDIIKVLKENNGFLMMSNLVLSSYQKRMGNNTGTKPGDEMRAAVNKAKELGIATAMVDRPIQITLRRAWGESSLWGKCKLLASLIASAFSKEEISAEEIEELKVRSEMDGMMESLAKEMPDVKRVLIDERDFYLASHIWQTSGNKVLAVLGAGHLPGVVSHLNAFASGSENPDCSKIDHVAPKSVLSKCAAWIFPALIIAIIAAGFVYGGSTKGWNMLGSWVLWNGILAMIGAILAKAHPLAILVSFIGAPLTSLCPLIGIGVVSGIVQAVMCKPKVCDMETLQDDCSSVKGFYKNRILRVLLVFILSSLGSSIGTFVAGAGFITSITSLVKSVLGK